MVTLSETETIWMLDILDTSVAEDSPDIDEVIKQNENYQKVCLHLYIRIKIIPCQISALSSWPFRIWQNLEFLVSWNIEILLMGSSYVVSWLYFLYSYTLMHSTVYNFWISDSHYFENVIIPPNNREAKL